MTLLPITLETLLRSLNRVEMQAAAILLTECSGSTHDVAEKVQRVVTQLADDVRDETIALARYSKAE